METEKSHLDSILHVQHVLLSRILSNNILWNYKGPNCAGQVESIRTYKLMNWNISLKMTFLHSH